MRNTLKYFVLIILFFACHGGIYKAQNPSQTPINQTEVNKITEVAVAFIKAYSKRDLATADSLSAASGEVKKRVRTPVWDKWQGRENLIFDNFVNQITRIYSQTEAGVRITFTLRETDLDNGQILNPISFDFSLIKENGKWKILDVGGSTRYIIEDLLIAKDDSAVLGIAKQEKIILNSTELNIILDELQNKTDVDRNKIIKISEILATQIEQPKYKNTFCISKAGY